MAAKLAKIAITTEADQALEAMLSKVNEGFRGGRVGEQELASWAIIMQLAGSGIDGCLEAIRAAHFDDVAYLGAVVKELRSARRAGGSVDVRAMLAPLVAAPDQPGRGSRSRKAQATDAAAVTEITQDRTAGS